ncbi:MAG TPA: HupE/UreJ family protein [Nannocystis exedens]|nr:HupE/UreJ family protein [Nannocystis exedens]
MNTYAEAQRQELQPRLFLGAPSIATTRPRPKQSGLVALALPIAALTLPSVAAAHALGLSQGRYRVRADSVAVTLTFARDDLRLLLRDLDADRDGQVREVEVMMGSAAIGKAITAGLVLSLDKRPCTPDFEGARLREEDGLEITLRYDCQSPMDSAVHERRNSVKTSPEHSPRILPERSSNNPPNELRIDFSALADFRGVHRHIAQIVPPGDMAVRAERVLGRLRPSVQVSLREFADRPPSKRRGLSPDKALGLTGNASARSDIAVDLPRNAATPVEPAGATIPTRPDRSPVDREYMAYLLLGIEHILSGFDHLVFLLGLVIGGGGVRGWALMITAFTLGHSLSLALASLEIVTPRATLIEALIAASIIYIGIENLLTTGQRARRRRWRLTLAFGFVHGFGFAGALLEIGLPPGHEVLVLALFNLGVELGQLLALAALAGSLALIPQLREPRWRRRINAMIVIAGLFWLLTRVFA